MPSGFQQDLDQLQSEAYRIVIDMANTTYFPTASSTATDNGGVTPNSEDSFSAASLPSTLTSAQNRARGNMRFRNIVNRLSGLSDVQILDIAITEPSEDIAMLSADELDSVITRVGHNCKVIFCGDFRQTDFTREHEKNGLTDFMRIVKSMKSFSLVEFEASDIVRSALVKEYIILKDKMRIVV